MSVRRFLPIALTLLLVSCAAAATTVTTPRPSLDRGASHVDGMASPSVAPPGPLASASPVTAPLAGPSPVGERIASAQADFDCDGRPDLLEFFSAPGPGTYPSLQAGKLARLTLSAGTVVELPFDGMPLDDPGSPLIGVADVNGDGCDDAIVTVGHGASTVWTSFLVYADGALRRVEENGAPAMFLFAGSVRHGNSIECRRTKDTPEIVARAVSDYTSDYAWDLVEDVHHWYSRSQLVLWSTTRSIIAVNVRYAMPTDQDRYWGLSCGNVKLAG
jgi:hypothetical protein